MSTKVYLVSLIDYDEFPVAILSSKKEAIKFAKDLKTKVDADPCVSEFALDSLPQDQKSKWAGDWAGGEAVSIKTGKIIKDSK